MGLPFWFCTSLHEFFPCCLPTSINLKHWVVCLCCWRFTGCTCSPSLQPVLPPVCVFRVCVMCLRTTTESKGGNRPVSYCSPTLTWYDSAPSLCVLFDALLCPHTPNYTDSTLALHTHTHTLKLFEQPRPQSHRPRLASDPWQPPMYTPTCWPVVAGFLLVKKKKKKGIWCCKGNLLMIVLDTLKLGLR